MYSPIQGRRPKNSCRYLCPKWYVWWLQSWKEAEVGIKGRVETQHKHSEWTSERRESRVRERLEWEKRSSVDELVWRKTELCSSLLQAFQEEDEAWKEGSLSLTLSLYDSLTLWLSAAQPAAARKEGGEFQLAQRRRGRLNLTANESPDKGKKWGEKVRKMEKL